jgi:hypothetical protein
MASSPDPAIARIDGLVSTYGFAVVSVGYGPCAEPGCEHGPSPHPWTYTVGLMAQMQPELVVMGSSLLEASAMVHEVVDRRRRGATFRHSDSFWAHDAPVMLCLHDVPDPWVQYDPSRMASWFAWNRGRYGVVPVVQQVVWSDDNDEVAFPFEEECDPAVVADQPVLSLDPFSFPEPADRATRRAARRDLGRRFPRPSPPWGPRAA